MSISFSEITTSSKYFFKISVSSFLTAVKLEKLINPTFDSLNDWTVKVEDVTYSIGCWKGVTKADIILILKTQKELPS